MRLLLATVVGLLSLLEAGGRQVEVEDVTSRQLEAATQTQDLLAVYWYSKNCKTCDRVLGVLERVGEEVADLGITLLRVNDKKSAKVHGVRNFPALSLVRSGDVIHYEGDLLDQEAVMDFFSAALSDNSNSQVDQVTASELELLVSQSQFVAVFFYTGTRSNAGLDELKNLIDLADKLDIRLVCINDLALVAEYSLGELPALVYYRHTIPILFEGDLNEEGDILEWLIQNRSSGDEEDTIEEVDLGSLEAMITAVENIAVLFYDGKPGKRNDQVLEALERIDDDCDTRGVHFVKISSVEARSKYEVSLPPQLVLFKNSAPKYYEGNLLDDEAALQWLLTHIEAAQIEEISAGFLGRVLRETKHAVVVFYKRGSREAMETLDLLETVDDDLERLGITMYKVSDSAAFGKWKIKDDIQVVFVRTGIPSVYVGDPSAEKNVLNWAKRQAGNQGIPEVGAGILQLLLSEDVGVGHEKWQQGRDVAVIFYRKGDSLSSRALKSLDNIQPDTVRKGLILVKTSEESVGVSYGLANPPSLVLFRKTVPHLYLGDLRQEEEVLKWMLDQSRHSSIEEVTGKMLDSLIESNNAVISFYYDADNLWGEAALTKLEKIDDDLDRHEVLLVKMSDMREAREYGVKDFPSIIMFVNKVPELFEGDVSDESAVLGWALVQLGVNPAPGSESAGFLLPAAEAGKVPPPQPERVAPTPPTKPRGTGSAPLPPPTATQEIKTEPKEVEEEEIVAETAYTTIETENQTKPASKQVKEEPEEENEIVEAIQNENNVVAFFYENLDKISKKIMTGLDRVEAQFLGKDITFLSVNVNEIPDISVSSVPSLIYFKNGAPYVYEENLMNEESITNWIDEELKSNQDVIEDLNSEQIHDLMNDNSFVMVYLYTADCEACDEAIKQLEQIDDDTDAVGVKFVKTDDAEFATEYGIETFPAILYFEDKEPSIYDGDAAEETELLTWLLYQMKEDTIENINRDLLNRMIDDFEFLAVFFFEDNEDSVKVLRHLELIDDEASQYGVRIVKINDPLMSKKYGHRAPPGLGFFRKGNYIKFDGDLFDDEEMLDWLTDPNTMEISDQIEKVNKKMFEKLISRNEFLTVFFYSDSDCKQCSSVLSELENIDDDADVAGIPIVKLEDKQLAKTVGVFALPAIVFFRNFGEEATIYAGDLKREESILEWLLVQKDPNQEGIEEQEGEELRASISGSNAVAVFVYSREECEDCLTILTELENIDDDVGRQKISMIKTTDADFAAEVGVENFPSLVFFKDGVPNLYEGDMTVEEEVLDWLIEMKVESHIELITRPMLETMVEEVQYLAVFFYKQNCRTCDLIIAELEHIDDECDLFGIQMVKLKDPPLAKRYGIKTFPALVYFRNGNPLTFDGDLKSEESVLEWLTDDDNRELEDEIEAVNFRMLDKLLESSPLIAVFFYDDECIECEAILEQLENIDDEADEFGIDFVKNDDPHAARQYNIYNTPALVYFRRMTPVVYDGDLMEDDRILEWLTSQDVFETKDEIEEVNRRMLEKLLEENEFVAVYFYEDNCAECDEVLLGLEKIDDETDALDITLVKVNDPRYAKKYGVTKLPALVYFRRKFPSIYRDSLLDEDTVLEWITTNRYKQMELGVFMYAIIALAITFMCYTAFLMFGLKPKEPEKKKEE